MKEHTADSVTAVQKIFKKDSKKYGRGLMNGRLTNSWKATSKVKYRITNDDATLKITRKDRG